jgi:hypothetical protein
MGAWGPGNFENDAVSDWLAEAADWSAIERALTEVLHAASNKYVSANACCVALGAAEVVAACLGRPDDGAPPKVLELATTSARRCDAHAVALAVATVRKIETGSELQELFDEGGRNEEWHTHVQNLVRRLSS